MVQVGGAIILVSAVLTLLYVLTNIFRVRRKLENSLNLVKHQTESVATLSVRNGLKRLASNDENASVDPV